MDDLDMDQHRTVERSVLLLSGGLDSASIASWKRPPLTLFVDYGQRPAAAELAASRAISGALGLNFESMRVDASSIGAGLLAGAGRIEGAPSEEWWPFRNQMLVTFAATWLVHAGLTGSEILVGSVRPDRKRHRDGSPRFYRMLNDLLKYQEGSISVQAPAISLTTEQLVLDSGVADGILGWTHSCHVSTSPCLACPGCYKRQQVLENVQRLQ